MYHWLWSPNWNSIPQLSLIEKRSINLYTSETLNSRLTMLFMLGAMLNARLRKYRNKSNITVESFNCLTRTR